jgi:hypothetical protein
MKLNEDDVERKRADSRWKWQMDQAARERYRYRKGLAKGRREAEAKYRPALEEKDREIGVIKQESQAIKQESQVIKQEIGELRRKLREAGIEG